MHFGCQQIGRSSISWLPHGPARHGIIPLHHDGEVMWLQHSTVFLARANWHMSYALHSSTETRATLVSRHAQPACPAWDMSSNPGCGMTQWCAPCMHACTQPHIIGRRAGRSGRVSPTCARNVVHFSCSQSLACKTVFAFPGQQSLCLGMGISNLV